MRKIIFIYTLISAVIAIVYLFFIVVNPAFISDTIRDVCVCVFFIPSVLLNLFIKYFFKEKIK